MSDWQSILMIVGMIGLFIFSLGVLNAWWIRDSKRSTRECTLLLNESTRRSIERMDRAHRRNSRLMDAHIAMILERVDRGGAHGG